MEILVLLFGIGVGIGIAIYVAWKLILFGHQEGNRQDYITKIGLLKKELRDKNNELREKNNLLSLANQDCHRSQRRLRRLNLQLEHFVQNNRDLIKE